MESTSGATVLVNSGAIIELLENPFQDLQNYPLSEIISAEVIQKVSHFHQSLADYKATPVIALEALAKKLKLNQIVIKDESKRFDLNAFKVLGASYAMARVLAEKIGLQHQDLDFSDIYCHREHYQDVVFITTTDGNHGRAVAWAAQKFGCRAVVYMPKGSSLKRLRAIKEYGAEAYLSELGYDDCVNYVSKLAKTNNWLLLQDTAWPGYQKIPRLIMQGYFSLITEFIEQFPSSWPSHILVQAGVGSLAAALAILVQFYSRHDSDKPMPVFVVVEPTGAPCFFESIKINDGAAHRTAGELKTIMAGLACGKPSDFAWDVLKHVASNFLVCDDEVTVKAMRQLAHPETNDAAIISGESGAVTLGVLIEIMQNSQLKSLRKQLKLNINSRILLFSTEGNTDADIYASLVN